MTFTMIKNILMILICTLLAACAMEEAELLQASIIDSGDECQVCGMLINRLPGPKGQAIFDHRHVKFCSTRDMVSFFNDEENTHRVSQLFVHDMASNDWQAPNPSDFIDGGKAWYVEGSSKTGGMGPTFASFLHEGDAKKFAEEFGGKIKTLSQLSQP